MLNYEYVKFTPNMNYYFIIKYLLLLERIHYGFKSPS